MIRFREVEHSSGIAQQAVANNGLQSVVLLERLTQVMAPLGQDRMILGFVQGLTYYPGACLTIGAGYSPVATRRVLRLGRF
jgi:hypothetical protein